MNATPRQLFALYCATKIKTVGLNITLEKASDLISRSKKGEDISQELIELGGISSGVKVENKVDYKKIVDEAHKRAFEAASNHKPQPMVVVGHANPLDDNSNVTEQYYVESGICGFSQIRMKLNTSFGKWLVKNNIAQKSCMGGCYIYVGFFGQSYEKKDKYSREYAKVLNEHGFDCIVESRID